MGGERGPDGKYYAVSKYAQIWPKELCVAVVRGIELLFDRVRGTRGAAYPIEKKRRQDWDCKACQQGKSKTAPSHTRAPGGCRWSDVEPAPDWRVRGTTDRPPRVGSSEDSTATDRTTPSRLIPDVIQEGRFDEEPEEIDEQSEPASSSKDGALPP